jgi:hypothetical protein
MPGTEDFRINIDHKISEAEARVSDSEAIPFGETPEQRKREFQDAKFYARVRTAIRRIKKFGLRLCICSITLAFVSQTKGKDWQREKPGEPLGVRSWVGIEGDDTDKCGGSRPMWPAA